MKMNVNQSKKTWDIYHENFGKFFVRFFSGSEKQFLYVLRVEKVAKIGTYPILIEKIET